MKDIKNRLTKGLHSRSAWNLITGLGYQGINMLMGLILPYLFITKFGSETNGLLNSINQFFLYLGLLEAGIAATSIQALYTLVADGNKDGINGVLSATHKYYKKAGAIYAVLLIGLSFLYPLLVVTDIPFSTVALVILLQGAGSVWSFFFQAKYEILLKADGKYYIFYLVLLFSTVARNAGKIIAIALGYDIITVQLINFAVTIVQSAVLSNYVKRKYPWIDFQTEPNEKAIAQHNYAIVKHLAFLVFNHTDILTLTFILQDLKLVSVYSVYSLVFDAIQNLVEALGNSLHYKLGQCANDVHALRNYFIKYEKTVYCFSLSLNVTAYLLLRAFLNLYVGDVTDVNYMVAYLPELFLIMRLMSMHRYIEVQLINAVGHFKSTQNISIVEMALNLVSSIVLVFALGIQGVVIGTIIALVYSTIAYTLYCNKHVLHVNGGRGWLFTIAMVILAIPVCLLGRALIPPTDNYFSLVCVAAAVCAAVFLVFGTAVLLRYKLVSEHWPEK